MDIAILGTGNVGAALGRRWANVGHQIHFGSRQPEAEKVRRLIDSNPAAHRAGSVADAVAVAPVVVLATPFDYALDAIQQVADWRDKVLIDCTNPLNASFDGLQLGFTESAAEKIAASADGAKVVKAFNTASVATMENPRYGEQQATMFYCGDDAEAKQVVGELISQLDMEAVDSGPLQNARYLEPLAMLYIHLAVREGWGGNCALKMLRR